MTIASNGNVYTSKGVFGSKSGDGALNLLSKGVNVFSVNNASQILLPKVYETTSDVSPNLYIGANGVLYRATRTSYSAEEVDTKLAAKDKLIEKLSERLDKLEKKLKKAK
jgi:hypothetical protein